MSQPTPNKCWRCGRDILRPGGNYQCSSGAWILNGTTGEAVAQFNFVIGSKNTSEAQKKVAHKEALAYGFNLGTEKDVKKRRYACKPGTEDQKLSDLSYSKVARAKLKALCDSAELIRSRE